MRERMKKMCDVESMITIDVDCPVATFLVSGFDEGTKFGRQGLTSQEEGI